jgi:protein-tyrosine-phosphatase
MSPLRILVLCTGNSARSQLAEALFRAEGGDRVHVESAGSDPRSELNPLAIEAAMTVLRLDLAGQYPKPVSDLLGEPFDVVVTVCDRAAGRCPVFPGSPERVHWSLPDPETPEDFAGVARTLRERVREYLRARLLL